MLNQGTSALDLSPDQIHLLKNIIMDDATLPANVHQVEVPWKKIPDDMRVWPGIIHLSGDSIDSNDITRRYTLESIFEELKYRDHLTSETREELSRLTGLNLNLKIN